MIGRTMLLVLIYLSITILTGILLYLMTKYIKEKPFGAQFVTDYLSVDIAITIFFATAITSHMVIVRETLGPISEQAVQIFGIFQQLSSASFSINILSLQIAQFNNIFFADSLNEYKEAHVVLLHRSISCICYLSMTAIYCVNGYGVCRPLPLKFYFRGLSYTEKYLREPVSVSVTVFIILLLLVMQACIELKKQMVQRKEKEILRIAINANKTLAIATLQLELQKAGPATETGQEIVKEIQNHHLDLSQSNCFSLQISEGKLKVARAATFFCVFPTVVFVVTVSLEGIDSIRPHGATASILFSYGVLVPFIFFFVNKKMFNFAKKQMTSFILSLKISKPKAQIHPIA